MPSYRNLLAGDPAPWFAVRATTRRDFHIDTAAGRYIVLCFFVSTAEAKGRAAVEAAFALKQRFDDAFASFLGVTIDPADEATRRVAGRMPGYHFLWDFDGQVSALYGAVPRDAKPDTGEKIPVRRLWVVLDPTLRIMKVVPFADDGSDAQVVASYLGSLPPPSHFAGFEVTPPILVLPNVFESEFCETLVSLYEQHGGSETGFMQQVDGKTIVVHGHDHKRRSDYTVVDPEIIDRAQRLIKRRIVPEIRKVHQFEATFVERHIVACYSAEDGGHFRPHRDNTTRGTAHRRFAVSINLNADFDGGEIIFPEYGYQRRFKPPIGGAVVFSCSLLHAVSKVTRGRRYAYLPFLYDKEAAKVREANSQYLETSDGSEERADQLV